MNYSVLSVPLCETRNRDFEPPWSYFPVFWLTYSATKVLGRSE